MKLKVIICALLFCTTTASAQQISIRGQFHSTQKEFDVEDISEFQYLRTQDEKLQVMTGPEGKFEIQFKLARPGYYRIGRNILYLSPGDDLTAEINHSEPNTSTFNGIGGKVNTYLRDTPFPKGGSYLESGKLVYASPREQFEAIIEKANQRTHQLGLLKGADLNFIDLEKARIQADVINSITSVGYYAPRKLKLKPDSAERYLAAFEKISQPTVNLYLSKLHNSKYLQLTVFRDISRLVVNASAKDQHKDNKSNNQITDWINADSLVNIMKALEDKSKIAVFDLSSIKSLAYLDAAKRTKQAMLAYGNGDLAKDFAATDTNGTHVKLSDLKGKIIFIDLWATWCGPCLEEMPAFEQLKRQYSNDPQVVFISLSIDENLSAWKKNVASRGAEGLQWHISRNELANYQLATIPRTIIINQQFKIVNFRAPVPSSKKNIELLDQLSLSSRQPQKFNIDGKLMDVGDNSLLFLTYFSKAEKMVRDSVRLSSGEFHFEGEVDGLTQANLLLSKVGYYSLKKNSDQTDIFLSNSSLSIKGTDSISSATVFGDEENIAYQQLKDKLTPLKKSQMAILYSLTTENRKNQEFVSAAKQKNNALVVEQKRLEKAYVLRHPNLNSSLTVLKSYAGPVVDASDVAQLYDGLSEEVKLSKLGKDFGKTIELLKPTGVGRVAPDFSSKDAKGKPINLSDLRGKYVLLDFWASWCAPCRAENPNIKALYSKFGSDKFEVLGVSLDSENAKALWLNAIKEDGLTWLNVSELNGFQCKAAKLYHIEAIPQNFLISPAGEILAKNIHGRELEIALEKLIDKPGLK